LASRFAILLGVVFAAMIVLLAYRRELTFEFPIGGVRVVSERTRDILSETQGSIKVACFMDRRHPMFRPVARLLKGFQMASKGVAGAEIVIEYVDPRWDMTRAGQLAGYGVPVNALMFERQRRRMVVTLDEMMAGHAVSEPDTLAARQNRVTVFRGERVCASAIAQLSRPRDRSVIYWLQGHGEARWDDYDPLRGFSDIAREIQREGYDVRSLDLAGLERIPEDCRVLLIVGPRLKVAMEERDRISAYLQRGGRLLYLATARQESGLEALLEQWGIRVTSFIAVSQRTLSGKDVLVTRFAEHRCTRNLNNASVVFGQAACLESLVESRREDGMDRPHVTLLAKTDETGWGELSPDVFPRQFDPRRELKGPVAVVAVSERGSRVAKDVAYRPGRLGVFGEASCVMNGVLSSHANANRDLFMNVLSWLVGVDAETASSLGGDAALVTEFSDWEWKLLMIWAVVFIPSLFLLLFLGVSRLLKGA